MCEFKVLEKTLGQILDENVARYPDNDAVIYVDRGVSLSYRALALEVDALAKGLLALGVKKGEKVAIWATNVPFWVSLQFATAKIGAILMPLNIYYRTIELEYVLEHSEVENIFVINGFQDNDFIRTIYEIIPELNTQSRDNIKSAKFPNFKRACFLGQEKHRGFYSIHEIMALSEQIDEDIYNERKNSLSPYDTINMQYTSGTTGHPKGVMLSHVNLVNNGFWIGENQKFTEKDRVCLPVPFFHCFGCVLGVIAAVSHSSTLVVLESFHPLLTMAAIEMEDCTVLYGVPTMFISILGHKLFNKFDYSKLRTGIMAGSPCPTLTMEQAMGKLNMREITICYGLTEASPVISQTRISDTMDKRINTVGCALPGIEVRITNPETGEICPINSPGEICCRGYNVMRGYYKMEEATKEAIDSDGWLHSGDIGTMDADGYITLTGRIKDMIIRGGENIYPREIEEFLHTLPSVLDVQVVGVPNRRFGEEVGVFFILKEGKTYTPEDIKDFCRGQIARYKIPKHIAFIKEFPLTASGKIKKFELRRLGSEIFDEGKK